MNVSDISPRIIFEMPMANNSHYQILSFDNPIFSKEANNKFSILAVPKSIYLFMPNNPTHRRNRWLITAGLVHPDIRIQTSISNKFLEGGFDYTIQPHLNSICAYVDLGVIYKKSHLMSMSVNQIILCVINYLEKQNLSEAHQQLVKFIAEHTEFSHLAYNKE